MSQIVQYILIRSDLYKSLKWPLGAVIAQACHASIAVIHLYYKDEIVQQYVQDLDNMRKVVLEVANGEELNQINKTLEENDIKHKIWIEQPENAPTCIAVKPYAKNDVHKYFRSYKLYNENMNMRTKMLKVAVAGCAHGELEAIYDTIKHIERIRNINIQLLICCGDFQSTRNLSDLKCMAVPDKYSEMGSFYKYYSGEVIAPVLTIFVGGNHEASNYLQELEYGGWVAQNIYYMGYASVINVAGIRIAGISGIYKERDYMKGHFEHSPYNNDTKRSVYHTRNIEVFRLKQLKEPIDIMISHDWPTGVYNYGSVDQLIKRKPFFKEEVRTNTLGSKPLEELLFRIKPSYWFAAHLHTKFAALVHHNIIEENGQEENHYTRFLALDKCLPGRDFLQVLEIARNDDKKNEEISLSYDLEWLTVLHLTDHLSSTKRHLQIMPGPNSEERWSFTPTDEEKQKIFLKFNRNLKIPSNFVKTAPIFENQNRSFPRPVIHQPEANLNPQTKEFCSLLEIQYRLSEISLTNNSSFNSSGLFDVNRSSLSFINTSESEEDNNYSDNDKNLTISSTNRSRQSLSLPLPNFDITDKSIIDDSSFVSSTSSDNMSGIIGSNLDVRNIGDSDCSINFNDSVELVKNPNEVEPVHLAIQDEVKTSTPKLLMKRRNQSFYDNSTTTDD